MRPADTCFIRFREGWQYSKYTHDQHKMNESARYTDEHKTTVVKTVIIPCEIIDTRDLPEEDRSKHFKSTETDVRVKLFSY